MSTTTEAPVHCLRVDLHEATFAKLKRVRDLTGSGTLVAVVRRAIDEYAERVLDTQISVIETNVGVER